MVAVVVVVVVVSSAVVERVPFEQVAVSSAWEEGELRLERVRVLDGRERCDVAGPWWIFDESVDRFGELKEK